MVVASSVVQMRQNQQVWWKKEPPFVALVVALLISPENKQPPVVGPSREVEQPVAEHQHAEAVMSYLHERQWWPRALFAGVYPGIHKGT